jgi:Zn-finger nucleic acid-binding protein
METPESLSCPRCGATMTTRPIGSAHGDGEVAQCPDGHGVFLARADLGALVEAESDWHRHAGQHTTPVPRITADMTVPPAARVARRAWVETLFG